MDFETSRATFLAVESCRQGHLRVWGAVNEVGVYATLLTMESGNLYRDILHDAVLVTRGGSIEAIVGREDLVLPMARPSSMLREVRGLCFAPR